MDIREKLIEKVAVSLKLMGEVAAKRLSKAKNIHEKIRLMHTPQIASAGAKLEKPLGEYSELINKTKDLVRHEILSAKRLRDAGAK